MKNLSSKLSAALIQEVQLMGPEELEQLTHLIEYQWSVLDKRAKDAVRNHFYSSTDIDFHYKGKHYKGVIEKYNPKLLRIKTVDENRFNFPYILLAEILNLALTPDIYDKDR